MDEWLKNLFANFSATADRGAELSQATMDNFPSFQGTFPGQDMLRNVIEGADPTGGAAVRAVGAEPRKTNIPIQLMAGVLAPGMKADEAERVLGGVKSVLSKIQKHRPGFLRDWVTQGRGSQFERIQQAFSSAPTGTVEHVTDLSFASRLVAPDEAAEASAKLLEAQGSAELAARAITGEPEAVDLYSHFLGFNLTDEAAEILEQHGGLFDNVEEFDELLGRAMADVPEGYVNFSRVGEELNHRLSDVSLYKLLLGID